MKAPIKDRHGLLLAALLVAIGCGQSKEKDQGSATAPATEAAEPDKAAAGADASTLVLYSGRTEALVAPLISAFEAQSGIKVQVKYADSAQLAATLLEEGARSPADVFLAQDASTLGLLAGKDIFLKLPDSITGRVGPGFKDPNGLWVGTTGRARVLAYNTKTLKPEDLPASAAELTDPKWKGRVGWAPENASFQSALSAMIQLEGKDAAAAWIKGMQQNQPKAYPKNSPAVEAVSRGEVDVALVNHYYLYRLRAEHGKDFPVENHYFRSGKADSLVNVSGAAILKSAPHREAAEKLITYLLSDEAQSKFAAENYEFPLVAGIKTPLDLPDITTLSAPVVDLAALDDLAGANAILKEAGALP